MRNTKKLAMAGILVALGVVCSAFYIPIGASKCFPVQHFVNVLAGVMLGPVYSLGMAFCTSLIRFMMGTGTLLAFPGSMIGAFLAGICYKTFKKTWVAAIGEVVGTGFLGAWGAYFIGLLFMGRQAAMFALVIPFGLSSICGSVLSFVVIQVLEKSNIMSIHKKLESN